MPYPLKKLGDVVKTIRGVTYKPVNVKNKEDGLACFRTKNIQEKLDESDIIYIDDFIVKNEEKFLQNGDLLISSANSLELLGKCCLIENLSYKATLGGFISCFRPLKDIIDYKFFYYFYNSNSTQYLVRSFSKKTTGIANLQLKDLENLQIPLPPLPTQKAIVQKLDEAFARIDASIELAEKSLKAIEEGNASVLEEVFGSGEYEERRLGDLVKIIGGGTPSKAKKEYYTGNILWATVGDMNVETIYDTQLKITEEGLKDSSSNIVSSDGIIIATRVGLGKVCYVSQDTAINQDLKGLIPNNNLDKKYLYRFFQSIEKYILQHGTGATVKGVKLDFVKQIKLPLPPLSKQKEIVEYLDRVFAVNAELRRAYEEKIHSLKELKQSLLREAFEGRLVP